MSSKLKPDRSARRLRERDSYPPISDKGYYQTFVEGGPWDRGDGVCATRIQVAKRTC
jgi:hypothetical protein